jgi:hypothetical protein
MRCGERQGRGPPPHAGPPAPTPPTIPGQHPDTLPADGTHDTYLGSFGAHSWHPVVPQLRLEDGVASTQLHPAAKGLPPRDLLAPMNVVGLPTGSSAEAAAAKLSLTVPVCARERKERWGAGGVGGGGRSDPDRSAHDSGPHASTPAREGQNNGHSHGPARASTASLHREYKPA